MVKKYLVLALLGFITSTGTILATDNDPMAKALEQLSGTSIAQQKEITAMKELREQIINIDNAIQSQVLESISISKSLKNYKDIKMLDEQFSNYSNLINQCLSNINSNKDVLNTMIANGNNILVSKQEELNRLRKDITDKDARLSEQCRRNKAKIENEYNEKIALFTDVNNEKKKSKDYENILATYNKLDEVNKLDSEIKKKFSSGIMKYELPDLEAKQSQRQNIYNEVQNKLKEESKSLKQKEFDQYKELLEKYKTSINQSLTQLKSNITVINDLVDQCKSKQKDYDTKIAMLNMMYQRAELIYKNTKLSLTDQNNKSQETDNSEQNNNNQPMNNVNNMNLNNINHYNLQNNKELSPLQLATLKYNEEMQAISSKYDGLRNEFLVFNNEFVNALMPPKLAVTSQNQAFWKTMHKECGNFIQKLQSSIEYKSESFTQLLNSIQYEYNNIFASLIADIQNKKINNSNKLNQYQSQINNLAKKINDLFLKAKEEELKKRNAQEELKFKLASEERKLEITDKYKNMNNNGIINEEDEDKDVEEDADEIDKFERMRRKSSFEINKHYKLESADSQEKKEDEKLKELKNSRSKSMRNIFGESRNRNYLDIPNINNIKENEVDNKKDIINNDEKTESENHNESININKDNNNIIKESYTIEGNNNIINTSNSTNNNTSIASEKYNNNSSIIEPEKPSSTSILGNKDMKQKPLITTYRRLKIMYKDENGNVQVKFDSKLGGNIVTNSEEKKRPILINTKVVKQVKHNNIKNDEINVSKEFEKVEVQLNNLVKNIDNCKNFKQDDWEKQKQEINDSEKQIQELLALQEKAVIQKVSSDKHEILSQDGESIIKNSLDSLARVLYQDAYFVISVLLKTKLNSNYQDKKQSLLLEPNTEKFNSAMKRIYSQEAGIIKINRFIKETANIINNILDGLINAKSENFSEIIKIINAYSQNIDNKIANSMFCEIIKAQIHLKELGLIRKQYEEEYNNFKSNNEIDMNRNNEIYMHENNDNIIKEKEINDNTELSIEKLLDSVKYFSILLFGKHSIIDFNKENFALLRLNTHKWLKEKFMFRTTLPDRKALFNNFLQILRNLSDNQIDRLSKLYYLIHEWYYSAQQISNTNGLNIYTYSFNKILKGYYTLNLSNLFKYYQKYDSIKSVNANDLYNKYHIDDAIYKFAEMIQNLKSSNQYDEQQKELEAKQYSLWFYVFAELVCDVYNGNTK